MKKIYSNYFQKSKVFLYPLLGIKKGIRFVPLQTYISWGKKFPESKNKFFCLYEINKKNILFIVYVVFVVFQHICQNKSYGFVQVSNYSLHFVFI